MIKITNLHKFYNKGRKNEQHVLNDINLELGNTGLVCILGESGSGKTTLLNTIGGIDTFSVGVIYIDLKTIKNNNSHNFRCFFFTFLISLSSFNKTRSFSPGLIIANSKYISY